MEPKLGPHSVPSQSKLLTDAFLDKESSTRTTVVNKEHPTTRLPELKKDRKPTSSDMVRLITEGFLRVRD